MKVLIVNTSELTGGAAVAASRLCDALNNYGVKAKMLVRDKQTADISVSACGHALQNRWNFLWERVVIWLNNRLSRESLFKVSIANTGIDITKTHEFQEADIIHLHWVNQGLLSLKGISRILQSGKPVVWTMHDMWPLTAICHHAYACTHFEESCGECPFLAHPAPGDLSARVFRKKQTMLSSKPRPSSSLSPAQSPLGGEESHPFGEARKDSTPLTFVAVSEWLAGKARQSALIGHYPIHVIPNVLSLQQFTRIDRIDARTAIGVSERYVIAFGAARIDNPIKGFGYLKEALQLLVTERGFKAEDLRLLLFGQVRDAGIFQDLPVPYTHLGYIDDSYRLSQVYSASNATVSSSLYETFGQTLIEAMACGCVPVSFDGSGQADIISHQENGFLARRLSAESLAEGIDWALHCQLSPQDLRRSVLRRYSESVVARQYMELYHSAQLLL
ncbi:MAG: glycosyltransferase [Prevotella sp.]|nr:glycosyltransferase [Prevotella sp.]